MEPLDIDKVLGFLAVHYFFKNVVFFKQCLFPWKIKQIKKLSLFHFLVCHFPGIVVILSKQHCTMVGIPNFGPNNLRPFFILRMWKMVQCAKKSNFWLDYVQSGVYIEDFIDLNMILANWEGKNFPYFLTKFVNSGHSDWWQP